ncbi:hypothetical protein F7725_026853 [Dissostichus mawsoni]|uniref:Uncharacterized protein n=1 Tax=Dissostichus mawsoni TaxID=36200 RepID=A0A7J5X9S3_DISMA|nr:hypothetical protein F7725_026853 [Dissostichus mawsoni]
MAHHSQPLHPSREFFFHAEPKSPRTNQAWIHIKLQMITCTFRSSPAQAASPTGSLHLSISFSPRSAPLFPPPPHSLPPLPTLSRPLCWSCPQRCDKHGLKDKLIAPLRSSQSQSSRHVGYLMPIPSLKSVPFPQADTSVSACLHQTLFANTLGNANTH